MRNPSFIILIFSALCLRAQEIEVKKCNCYMLGTFETPDGKSLCDVSTRKCSCLKNVVGIDCDKCKDGYFGLYTGKGCKFCACNMLGALKQECDDVSGKCSCKRGYTGHKCDKCQDIFPIIDGKCCQCPQSSSLSTACDRKGRCKCKPHTYGTKCEKCDENYYYDEHSGCTPCSPCYDLLKTPTETYENQLDTLMLTLESENSTNEYEEFEKSMAKLKGRIEKLDAKNIKLIDYGVIKSLHDFLLRVDDAEAKIGEVRDKIKEIGEKYNKAQSKLKSGMKHVGNERKLIGRLTEILKKSELIVAGLDEKTFDDAGLERIVADVKLIGEETKKLFKNAADDLYQLKKEIEKVKNFTGEIRDVKEDVVERLDEAVSFKKKVEGLKVNEIDLKLPANDNFMNSVEDRIGKFKLKVLDFDPKPLNDKLVKIQGYINYIEGVKQKNEEDTDEFMRIQANFNFAVILEGLEEIKKNIDELNKNYNAVNEKINSEVIPSIKRIQENFSKLDDLDEDEVQKLIEYINAEQRKLDAIIESKEKLAQALQAEEDRLKNFRDITLSDFDDEYNHVAELVADFSNFEDIKEKIAACEDLITFFKAMPMYEDNKREFAEVEVEIERLERYYEEFENFVKFKAELEADVKNIEDILNGFPEERNWCNVKDTIT